MCSLKYSLQYSTKSKNSVPDVKSDSCFYFKDVQLLMKQRQSFPPEFSHEIFLLRDNLKVFEIFFYIMFIKSNKY